eukprot:GHVQ01035956.1.p4 GENE.GHVQ01035956.1~~GHVQ01035956.1.p4  ORF type:complete len:211 (+),score=33.38 GHVQ01035956.1:5061-5693(+)
MGQKQSSGGVESVIFDMKLKSKELERLSRKCEKEVVSERLKVKTAVEKGNKEGARIYAQNAIRKKHESLNYLKLSSKMDAVGSRLEAAHRSQQMTQDIFKAVPGLSKAMNSLDVDKLSTNMDCFEKLFEDLDVRADYVTNAIDQTTATTTPVDQVDTLIQQVAEEHALDMSHMLNEAPTGTLEVQKMEQPVQNTAGDKLQDRLDNLRQIG